MVAEDDVDAESLQAQVDMTMSFAHNLVTSWIKPCYLAQLRSNATSILEEELRRPPRLGVGASVPSMPPLVHEASKLQRRLGKKGANNRDVAESHPQDSPKSDDEEHKGRPAKRKTKVDPFGHEASKKKRKANSEANPHLPLESDSKDPVSVLNGSTLGPLIHNSFSTKEQQIGPGDQRAIVPSRTKSSRETSAPVPGIINAESIGLHFNSMLPDKASLPLLNLGGPPEFTDNPGNGSELNIGFKKKRKRRRKRRTKTIAGTGDNLH